MATLGSAILNDDSDEDDGDFVPVADGEEEEDEEYERLEDGGDEEGMGKVKGGGSKGGGKRKVAAKSDAAKKRARGGGIYLSDDEDQPPAQPRVVEDAEEEAEEEKEEGKPEEKAPSKADDFFASMKHESKPKSKADDFFAQMMSGKVEKKAAPKGGAGGLAGIMSGLVSAKSSSSSGGDGAKPLNVASMFPKTVEKKETIVLKETREFAGEKVVVETKVLVGSAEHEAIKRKGPKSNLDNLLDKLSGKNKNITTLKKTEVDWGKYKQKEGLEDELALYRKDGYIEKQGFLQRSDARLEEILKADRQKEREARKPVSGAGID